MTKKNYLEALKSVLGRSILHCWRITDIHFKLPASSINSAYFNKRLHISQINKGQKRDKFSTNKCTKETVINIPFC